MPEGKEVAKTVRHVEFITPTVNTADLSPEKREELTMENEKITSRLREKEGEMIIASQNIANGMGEMTSNLLTQHGGGLSGETEATFEAPGVKIKMTVGNTDQAKKGNFPSDKNRNTLLIVAGLAAIVAIVYLLTNGHV